MTPALDRAVDLRPVPEVTLDPENWDEVRALGRRMVDDAMTYLETGRDRPVWTPVPDGSRKNPTSL